jgi:predicted LPLAT superfamily acyltransferase
VSGVSSQKRVFEKQILEEYVKSLEKVVKIAPEQWYNYYKFWI